MKYDIKCDFKDTKLLLSLIKNAYDKGVLCDKTQHLVFDNKTELYKTTNDLNDIFVRIYHDIIDGYLKTILVEDKENNVVRLYPISLYCDYDDKTEKYTFL